MTALRARNWKPILTAAVAAMVVAGLGGLATDLSPWYYALRKPEWQPPDWLFGPAWTLIFGLIALSAIYAWERSSDPGIRARVIALFALNGSLNILWSVFFFRLQRPDWALVEVALLWLSIVMMIMVLSRLSRMASVLLVPYLGWVTFASALNFEVVRLNYPFRIH